MLPTHIVRLDEAAYAPGAVEQMGTYPPGRSDVQSSHARKASLQTQLFGPRGVTSFTVKAQTPYEAGTDTASDARKTSSRTADRNVKQEAKAARWHTWEFRFYALVFAVAVPYMCYVPIRLSQDSNPNYPRFSSHLRPGWILGRYRDDSDFQYRTFRDYLPFLTLVMVAYIALSKLSESIGRRGAYEPVDGQIARPHRRVFLSIFTAAFIFALHGSNSLKLLFFCSVNYAIATGIPSTSFAPITPLFVWVWNIASLFAVHWNDGFPYAAIHSNLAFLDSYIGLLGRWQINFNISVLRLISFSMDYYWATRARSRPELNDDERSRIHIEPRKRSDVPLDLQAYTFHHYLLYILYPPLFIAGPIMGYNDFVRQLDHPLLIPRQYTLKYLFRLATTLLTMELVLHYMYVNAIKDSKAWRGATPMELSMIGFWNLIVVWLKLLIPWRFFRLWALADGVDAPENMIRCMANNYSTLGFWRSWHRSYNLWIVRYIYIPVGGSSNAIAATLLVFTFVALWHDLSLKLLAWGWLVTLFILPEILSRQLFPTSKYGGLWWFRHVCALGGVVNVLMMMSANLVGFAIGTDGMAYMWQQLLSSWRGLAFMLSASAVLFVGVQVMFEYREEELRRGVVRKC